MVEKIAKVQLGAVRYCWEVCGYGFNVVTESLLPICCITCEEPLQVNSESLLLLPLRKE